MQKILITIIGMLGFTSIIWSQNICESIGNDSLALFNNGYIIGPQGPTQPVHTDTKWVDVTGADSLFIQTYQHRLHDHSKIYDENDNLIWTWDGESTTPTWYTKNHSLFIGGNDSVRIEFYQGYPDYSLGYLQIVGMFCTSNSVGVDYNLTQGTFKVYPSPTDGQITIENGDLSILDCSIEVRNSIGQRVFYSKINQQQCTLDLKSFAGNDGLYFLSITDPNGDVIIKKLILQ